jgi:hypothetical protein
MMPAQRRGAACSSATPAGTSYANAAGTVMNSAYPPSASRPVNRASGHRFSRSDVQNRHRPQVECSHATPTRSPADRSVTSSPTASTTPTTWCPGTSGAGGRGKSAKELPPAAIAITRNVPGAQRLTTPWELLGVLGPTTHKAADGGTGMT